MVFVKVGELSELAPGKMKKVTVGDKEFLIINVDGKYYAIGARCTHAGGDLSQGSLEGSVVTCPRHKAKFDVATGKVVSGPRVPFFKTKINDDPSYQVINEGGSLLLKIE